MVLRSGLVTRSFQVAAREQGQEQEQEANSLYPTPVTHTRLNRCTSGAAYLGAHRSGVLSLSIRLTQLRRCSAPLGRLVVSLTCNLFFI